MLCYGVWKKNKKPFKLFVLYYLILLTYNEMTFSY